MTLRDTLLEVARRAPAARAEQFRENPFRAWMEHEAHKALTAAVGAPGLIGQGSAGKGRWADICWLALMNPISTTSAVRGLYVVYLFASDMSAVFLCQGQGVTAIRQEFGRGYREELERRSAVIAARVPEHAVKFSRKSERLALQASSPLGQDYELAPAYFRRYELNNLPGNEDLVADLQAIAALYELLLFRGGTDTLIDDDDTSTISETGQHSSDDVILERRRLRYHQKVERANLRKVKQALGYTCQACGFAFDRVYGELGRHFIEAHHLTPLHKYTESGAVSLNASRDFAVLCANCHRMVHRNRSRTLSVADLQAALSGERSAIQSTE
jgi:5-methylcytosine-specific restriction protein A